MSYAPCQIHQFEANNFYCLSNACLSAKECCKLCIPQFHEGHEKLIFDKSTIWTGIEGEFLKLISISPSYQILSIMNEIKQ